MNLDKEIEKQRLQQDLQEAKVYFNCNRCNAEIYQGNEYYCYERNILCEECFDELQSNEKFKAKRIAGDDNDN